MCSSGCLVGRRPNRSLRYNVLPMKAFRRLRTFFICAVFLASCGGRPTAFPTAGVTVQAFPHVEVFTATATIVPTEAPTFTPLPPTDTPLPTDTPVPTLTATALIQLAPPTATIGFVQPTGPRPTRTTPPGTGVQSNAPTTPAPQAAAIRFRSVQFVSAQHDASRPPDGSITTLSVEFTGSRPPFTIKHDNLTGGYNSNGDGQFDDSSVIYTFIYFRVLRTCGGTVVGTITVTGGDGQAFTHDYFVPDAPCS